MENIISLWQSTGLYNMSAAQAFMILVGFVLLYLAIKKRLRAALVVADRLWRGAQQYSGRWHR